MNLFKERDQYSSLRNRFNSASVTPPRRISAVPYAIAAIGSAISVAICVPANNSKRRCTTFATIPMISAAIPGITKVFSVPAHIPLHPEESASLKYTYTRKIQSYLRQLHRFPIKYNHHNKQCHNMNNQRDRCISNWNHHLSSPCRTAFVTVDKQ